MSPKITSSGDASASGGEAPDSGVEAALSPEAKRALREAEERRAKASRKATPAPREKGGRDGPDPVRYGDWEKGGIVSDF